MTLTNGEKNTPHGLNTDQVDLPFHTNAQGYTVPDTTYCDPLNRRIRVVTVGAGYSGILLAYRVERELQNIDHVIYEKNGDVGGAWLENRYPNCACDVPAHSYVYPFALNPDWPEYYSKSDAIWKYLDRVCRVWDLRKYMKFNHRVSEAVWDESTGKWLLKIAKYYVDGSYEMVDDFCDVLLQAVGLLNNPIIPNIDGIETFAGRLVHTAQWPSDFGQDTWKGRRIAVIGAGASAVQTVPGLQPYVEHIDLFVRSKTWLAAPGQMQETPKDLPNFPCRQTDLVPGPLDQQTRWKDDLASLVAEARRTEVEVNAMWKGMFKADIVQTQISEAASKKMADTLEREDLVAGFVPKFGYGCRRVSPGMNFMKAVKEPNVSTHFTAVVRVTPDGVVGQDGTEVKCDTIICATGFDTTFRPHYKLVGQDGVSLAEKWKNRPDGYLGISCPGFPNFVSFFGPSWPVFAGSVTASLSAVADLAIKMIRKIQTDDIRSIAPRQDVTDAFNVHTQALLHGTVWEDDCSSWYKNKDGRITAIWPGSGLHFQEVVREPRWEDYNIRYMNPHNMFAFMGRGFTQRERTAGSDMAPYMSVEALDMKFYDASIPWFQGPAPTKESARLKSAEAPPKTLHANGDRLGVIDALGPDGERLTTVGGATKVAVDEIGQVTGAQVAAGM